MKRILKKQGKKYKSLPSSKQMLAKEKILERQFRCTNDELYEIINQLENIGFLISEISSDMKNALETESEVYKNYYISIDDYYSHESFVRDDILTTFKLNDTNTNTILIEFPQTTSTSDQNIREVRITIFSTNIQKTNEISVATDVETVINKVLNKTKVYEGWQYHATGISGYHFYFAEDEVCSLDYLITLEPDVHINGFGMHLIHKNYDYALTLASGIRRTLIDEENQIQAFYEYITLNHFLCTLKKDSINVFANETGWEVYYRGKNVSSIKRVRSSEPIFRAKNFNIEQKVFEFYINQELPEEFYILVFAIPILGF